MSSTNVPEAEAMPMWAAAAVAADRKGGERAIAIDVGATLAICGSFVVVSASNSRMVRTLADAVEFGVRLATGQSPLRTEGLGDLRWVVLDFGETVVHVFLDEAREFYDLERLWGDAPRLDWTEYAAALPTETTVESDTQTYVA